MQYDAVNSIAWMTEGLSMIKTILGFIASVFIAAAIISLVSTQLVLAELQSFGIAVSLLDRLETTAKDLLGLGITLVVLIAPSFLIGFTIAKYAHKFVGGNRKIWYTTAGFLSFPVTLYLIKYFMGVTLLASARTSWGMLMVGLCCMLAGWLFATFTGISNSEEFQNEQ